MFDIFIDFNFSERSFVIFICVKIWEWFEVVNMRWGSDVIECKRILWEVEIYYFL